MSAIPRRGLRMLSPSDRQKRINRCARAIEQGACQTHLKRRRIYTTAQIKAAKALLESKK